MPSATIAMTAATPMIMPSIVSAVRSLLRPSALKAIRSVMNSDMRAVRSYSSSAPAVSPPGCRFFGLHDLIRLRRRQRGQFVGRVAPARHRLVGDDAAVTEADEPRAVLGDVHLVRDEEHRDAALLVQALEDAHDLDARARVEVAGRLVGEQNRRLVDERARDRDALLLTAGELVRHVVIARAQAHRVEHRERALVPLGRP